MVEFRIKKVARLGKVDLAQANKPLPTKFS